MKNFAGTSIRRSLSVLAGLVLLVLTLPPFFSFPWLKFWLVPLAGLYLFLLLLLPRLWLLVLPLATVGMDIAPFTGRFSYNELDLLFSVTLVSGLLYRRYRFGVFTPSPAIITLFLYIAVVFLGYSGWVYFILPPQAAMASPYYTSEYAYKLIKGLIWGVALVPMWGYLLAVDKRRGVMMLVTGLSSAAILLGLAVIWEKGTLGVLLAGSTMYAGGEAVHGLVLLLLPAALYGAVYGRLVWLRLLSALGALALAYVTLVEFAGASYATFVIAAAFYAVLTLWSRVSNNLSVSLPSAAGKFAETDRLLLMSIGILVLALLAFVFAGCKADEPIGTVNDDPEIRESYWGSVVASGGHGVLGNGIGSFPVRYIQQYPARVENVGSFSISTQRNREFLQVEGGRDLMLGQRVTITPHTLYTVKVHVRTEDSGRLDVALCERNLIYGSNFEPRCEKGSINIEANDGAIREYSLEINSDTVGERGALRRWPTLFEIRYDNPGSVLYIDAVSLYAGGFNLLHNGSFNRGLDHWFSYSDANYLHWHIKNIFLQKWFETGWLGLALFLALLGFLLQANLRRHAYDSLLPVYTTGVLSVCVFGLFGSPLDSARASWMFYFFLAAGLARLRVPGRSREAMRRLS